MEEADDKLKKQCSHSSLVYLPLGPNHGQGCSKFHTGIVLLLPGKVTFSAFNNDLRLSLLNLSDRVLNGFLES